MNKRELLEQILLKVADHDGVYCGKNYTLPELRKDLQSVLEAVIAEDWVSVDERLPEDKQNVLAVNMNGINDYSYPYTFEDNCYLVCYEQKTGIWWDEKQNDYETPEDLKIEGITHWKPIAPPKVG